MVSRYRLWVMTMTIESEHALMLSTLQQYVDNCGECHGLGEYDMLYYHVQGEPTKEHVKCTTCTWARDVLAQIDMDDSDDNHEEYWGKWIDAFPAISVYSRTSDLILSRPSVRNVKLQYLKKDPIDIDGAVDRVTGVVDINYLMFHFTFHMSIRSIMRMPDWLMSQLQRAFYNRDAAAIIVLNRAYYRARRGAGVYEFSDEEM